MTNILIIGGGFGGLTAAEELSERLGGRHRLTLVAPHDKFVFYPLLVRLAFGHLKPADITFDLPTKLNDLNVRFVQGEVIEIKPRQRRVRVAGDDFDGEIAYDYLIIAPGRRLATEKTPGFFEYAHHLLGINAAIRFGAAVKSFQKGHIVVGLAPDARLPVPVCETAFALARKFKDQIESSEISVSVMFPETAERAFGGANLHRKLEQAFKNHRLKITTDFPVREITGKTIIAADGNRIAYDLLMLVPPFRGQTMLGETNFTDEHNFVRTDNFLRVEDLEKTYAVGDVIAFPGPKLAYSAARQARVAAENIASEIEGGQARTLYQHEIAVVIDEGGAETLFLHYGIWDETLYHLKTGRRWRQMKNAGGRLWETIGEGFSKMKNDD